MRMDSEVSWCIEGIARLIVRDVGGQFVMRLKVRADRKEGHLSKRSILIYFFFGTTRLEKVIFGISKFATAGARLSASLYDSRVMNCGE